MNTINQKPAFIPKVYCNIFGHDFKISRNVTLHVKEYKCKTCKQQATTNSNGKLTILTPKFREINNTLEKVYNRRTARLAPPIFTESDLGPPIIA
ncbi:hypothetical protein BZARG_03655 [Bizionia argentinensis JUB59]|uniref:Uncharacterized protein n=1 Tax=Bizionia argentinensis JUB59 TaxID=1046627 RepID=A0A4V6I6V9_9FLAO|nr:hypothetical protein [Bizionia argentinensis]TLG98998.1 hypothetical protein BZARG_03655 [Bizionia argentinensis JUB59]